MCQPWMGRYQLVCNGITKHCRFVCQQSDEILQKRSDVKWRALLVPYFSKRRKISNAFIQSHSSGNFMSWDAKVSQSHAGFRVRHWYTNKQEHFLTLHSAERSLLSKNVEYTPHSPCHKMSYFSNHKLDLGTGFPIIIHFRNFLLSISEIFLLKHLEIVSFGDSLWVKNTENLNPPSHACLSQQCWCLL